MQECDDTFFSFPFLSLHVEGFMDMDMDMEPERVG